VVIQDQAGFHLPTADPRLPENLRLPPPTVRNSIRWNVSAACSRPASPTGSTRRLRRLEDLLFAASKAWTQPAKVAGLIDHWLADQVNSGAPI